MNAATFCSRSWVMTGEGECVGNKQTELVPFAFPHADRRRSKSSVYMKPPPLEHASDNQSSMNLGDMQYPEAAKQLKAYRKRRFNKFYHPVIFSAARRVGRGEKRAWRGSGALQRKARRDLCSPIKSYSGEGNKTKICWEGTSKAVSLRTVVEYFRLSELWKAAA